MKRILIYCGCLFLLTNTGCKKENILSGDPGTQNYFTTKLNFFEFGTGNPASGQNIEVGRVGQNTQNFLPYLIPTNGTILLNDVYSNSFQATPYVVNFVSDPGGINPFLYYPFAVLKNKDDVLGNYLFNYKPAFQSDRLREYKIPVYRITQIEVRIKQENQYVAPHAGGTLYWSYHPVYQDPAKGLKAESENLEYVNMIPLKVGGTLDTLIKISVLAGLECKLQWRLLESFTPDVIPPGYDPGFYLQFETMKSGEITTKKFQSGPTESIISPF